ncbi:leucyl/phenylalanyl-tRNA--protein transferase [Flavihumibacter stibioxidans]|uniref:Leucyl/phenylalanyl-tRNA--protein transferase n=1 Tax=Flavihumibacter stibioxidans TaxID=1834163 RepID=A0ABR7ME90_9BACT|nr:leucyl/phenylalanyl-tRNA--protein transferase [Flavihumibacter stibioxidans]MBC6493169.1 leucyl/phenylalanyl-tRNA--protein transferase [Flavihumibacter stibioxidans]
MPLSFLTSELFFPPVSQAEPDGLLAVGGDLSPERILLAYRSGIFPWYEEEPILWWSPDPRFVLFPAELKISKSMRPFLNREKFRFSVDEDFQQVMKNCQQIPRLFQSGTWINKDMIQAYTSLHRMGYAHSAEAWQDGKLVGGLYGVKIGKVFFGESMFSHVSNASKFAFIKLVQLLAEKGVVLIDCQVYTEHLESLGARMISREEFMEIISKAMQAEG